MQDLRNLRVNGKDDIRKNLIPKIKPCWECVEIKDLKGGFSHIMYLCHEVGREEDSIIVRVRHVFEGSPLENTEFEFRILQVLVQNRLFPQVHAFFANGYVYQYIKGKPLFTKDDYMIFTTDVLRKIACRMQKLHSLKVPYGVPENLSVFQRLISVVKERFQEPFPYPLTKYCVEDFVSELTLLESKAESLSNGKVLCHGDCHTANMITKNHTGEVIFVDFEWTHMGYLAEDIGFFLEMLQLNEITFNLDILVPIDHEEKFLQYYLEAGKCNSISMDSANTLQKQVKIFKLLCPLHVTVLTIAYPELASQMTGDFGRFLTNLFKRYFILRKEVCSEDKLSMFQSSDFEDKFQIT